MHDNSIELLAVISVFGSMFWSFAALFITCEISEVSTEASGKIETELIELDWYIFPIEVQTMLPTCILLAQDVCVIKIFGSSTIGRDTYKQVN